MKEILKELETKISQSKENNNNPLSVACIVSQCINDYFGGGFNPSNRFEMYGENETITLSDMKNKKLAMCAEKASVAQNCYAVMQEAGVEERFNPKLVNSDLTTNRGRELHSFIILENVNEEKTSWLFDIMNPTKYIYNGEERVGVAFYSISPEQLKEFKQGKSFKFKSIYEEFGYEVCKPDRYYGNGNVNKQSFDSPTNPSGPFSEGK